jgi:hypothetical protein
MACSGNSFIYFYMERVPEDCTVRIFKLLVAHLIKNRTKFYKLRPLQEGNERLLTRSWSTTQLTFMQRAKTPQFLTEVTRSRSRSYFTTMTKYTQFK